MSLRRRSHFPAVTARKPPKAGRRKPEPRQERDLKKHKEGKAKRYCAQESQASTEGKMTPAPVKVKCSGTKKRPGDRGKRNLQLLREMQSIQTSLQKDDISWDY